jgi:hypothetical protein
MPRSESALSKIDWRGWIVLAWAIVFGLRYIAMIIECRWTR